MNKIAAQCGTEEKQLNIEINKVKSWYCFLTNGPTRNVKKDIKNVNDC